MKEPYGKAVATQTGPEPWRCVRKDALQALVGVRAGWPLSRESIPGPGCRGCSVRPKAIPAASLSRDASGPRAVRDPMHVRRLFAQELGGPTFDRGDDGASVRAVNLPAGRQVGAKVVAHSRHVIFQTRLPAGRWPRSLCQSSCSGRSWSGPACLRFRAGRYGGCDRPRRRRDDDNTRRDSRGRRKRWRRSARISNGLLCASRFGRGHGPETAGSSGRRAEGTLADLAISDRLVRPACRQAGRSMVPTYVGIGRRPSGTPKEPRSEIPVQRIAANGV